MGRGRAISVLGTFLILFGVRCGSDGIDRTTMERIRQAHARMLTLDGSIAAESGSRILPRMEEGGLDAAFFVISVPQGELAPAGYENTRVATLEAVRRIKAWEEAGPRLMSLARTPGEAYRLEKEKRKAAYIGLGNATAIGNELSLISTYFNEGVRCLTLCGTEDNAICDSAFEPSDREDRGLSEFGRSVVAACNQVGMIIDLAHCSERSITDVVASSRAPVIVSHSAARAVCDLPGNLSDGSIGAIARKGGVIMVSFEPDRLVPRDRVSHATVASIVDHIDHIRAIAGIDGIGIGSRIGAGGGVNGCRDAGEILNLTLELLRRGYGESAVESIWGGNAMRVFKEVEASADRKLGGNRE